jgi:hypothetical protein
LRIIQSIPSPKAEPLKLWLAKVGSERLDEIENLELAKGEIPSGDSIVRHYSTNPQQKKLPNVD